MRHWLLLICLLTLPLAARAQTPTIHADLPLWTGKDGERMWPEHFSDGDDFGCSSRVAFGDWKMEQTGEEGETSWWRITNYGVFHCYAITRSADERENLATARFDYGFFVLIDQIRTGNGPLELWALQSGARPGSDYVLLARRPADGLIKSFILLPMECPRANRRDAGNIDIIRTAYCAINERSELIAFARRMAKRPPAGTVTLVETPAPEAADKEPASDE